MKSKNILYVKETLEPLQGIDQRVQYVSMCSSAWDGIRFIPSTHAYMLYTIHLFFDEMYTIHLARLHGIAAYQLFCRSTSQSIVLTPELQTSKANQKGKKMMDGSYTVAVASLALTVE